MHTHITYYATYLNNIVYIGSGLPTRYKHCISGTSHVYDLNRLYFTDRDNLEVHILKGYTSTEEALEDEKKLILEFKPEYNSQYLEGLDRLQINESEILKYKEDFIPIECIRESTNFKKLAKDYLDALLEENDETIEFIETYDSIFKQCRLAFKNNIDSEFSASSYQRKRLELRLNNQVTCNSSNLKDKVKTKFKINKLYTKSSIKDYFSDLYASEGLTKKAKATDIQEYFEVKVCKNKDLTNCFKIIRKL